ncbi:MAG: hypothetical protein ACK4NX_02535, partial [Candidatus Paceibacteria bacterium]
GSSSLVIGGSSKLVKKLEKSGREKLAVRERILDSFKIAVMAEAISRVERDKDFLSKVRKGCW